MLSSSWSRRRLINNFDWIHAPPCFEHFARLKIAHQFLRLKGSRHHEHFELFSLCLLKLKNSGQGKVGGQPSLMKFIKENSSYPLKFWIVAQPTLQHTISHVNDFTTFIVAGIKPHSITHLLAHFASHQARYESGEKARGNPTRLNDNDHAVYLTGLQQHDRNPGGLS